jgi:hypothetical protein
MRPASIALIAGLALTLEGASALRSSPMRARLARTPSVARASALVQPRALPRMMEISETPPELCDPDAEEVCMLPLGMPMTLYRTMKIGASFALWFFLNVMYNLTNKKCQNVFPMPWTMTVVSLFVGIPYVLFMWATGLRKAPKIDAAGLKKLFPIGFFHAAGHASAVIALGAGAVSFAQIVKSGEPVFTCLLSYVVLGQTFSPLVYASLLPIVGGVALASLKELSFTWVVRAPARAARARAHPPLHAPRQLARARSRRSVRSARRAHEHARSRDAPPFAPLHARAFAVRSFASRATPSPLPRPPLVSLRIRPRIQSYHRLSAAR